VKSFPASFCAASALCLVSAASTPASAEPRVHLAAGAAHAVGGSQQDEFGAGGGGSLTLEAPTGRVLGVQASVGAIVLSPGDAPSDPTIARKETGSAFLGTVGVRMRPLGAYRVAGPWIDANGGVVQTGANGRVAIDTHIGWDFRVSRESRWDVGPFVGYTQILQSESALRTDDARIAWVGLAISLGAPERPKGSAPPEPMMGKPTPPPDRDGAVEAFDACPPRGPIGTVPEGCPTDEVRIVDDRLVIDDIIHFEFDSPRIRPESEGLVRRVAQFIVDHADIQDVSIEGHADAKGTEAYNQRLSEARAESTRAMLVRFGVDAGHLRVQGHGKSHLVVPTPKPDERNRRVEFIVSRPGRPVASSPSPTPKVASGKRGRP